MESTVKAYAAAQTANELALSILLYVLLLIILYLLCGCLDSHFLVFILQTLSYSVKHFNLLIPLKFVVKKRRSLELLTSIFSTKYH